MSMRRVSLVNRICRLTVLCLAVFGGTVLQAAATLPGFFTSNMVLQRDKPIPVWGWAEAGETVTVRFAGQEVKSVTDGTGRWTAALAALPASGEGRELSVFSDRMEKPLTLANIVVGDVWICSGQSNMEWVVNNSHNAKEEIAAARFPLIRHIKISSLVADTPASDVKGTWVLASPETAGGFTAVGYYFAKRLHQELGVPIGLIGSNWGGTRVEPWMAPEGFRRVPELKAMSDLVDSTLPSTESGKAAYLSTLEKINAWLPQMQAAVHNGTPLPVMPVFPRTGTTNQDPTRIYNAMIYPLIPFAIRGVIWYQGESNGGEGVTYFQKKRALIEGWRELWKQGDFPFYFVQLANFGKPSETPEGGDGWAKLREAQVETLVLPNTGMAVTIDIGDAADIHPKNKQDVGERLALWALAGEFSKELVYSGPLYREQKIEGNKVRISFNHAAGGLMVGKKEGVTPTAEVKDGKLAQFAIAGEDKKWYLAEAEIDGETVIVSSAAVAEPKAVRYAFRQNPEGCNLYNRAGLPASPFRTDQW